MEDRIKKIFALILEIDVERVREDFSAEDLENWDSLKQMNLIVALEEEFGIRFEEEESLLLNDYSALRTAIEAKTNSNK